LVRTGEVGDDEETDEGVYVGDDDISDNLYPGEDGREPDIQNCGVGLPVARRKQLHEVMRENLNIFNDNPGRTSLVEHVVETGDSPPVRQKPYRIPYSQREKVKEELDGMLKAGIIQPSVSPWVSPIVLVPKKDGSIRFCVDYRKLKLKGLL